MASIERRGKKWRVRWRDPDGKARSRSASTSALAKSIKRQVEAAEDLGRRWDPRDDRPDPDVVVEAYLKEMALLRAPTTMAARRVQLRMWLRWLAGREGGDVFSRAMLGEYVEHLRTRRRAASSSIVKYLQAVEGLWRWAADHDQWHSFIPRPRPLRLPPAPQRPTRAPTWEEMDAAIGACDELRRGLALLLRFTGLRKQQAMGLRWQDVDLELGVLTLAGDLGKSRQERAGRQIPLCPALTEEMRRWPRSGVYVLPDHRPGDKARYADGRDMRRAWRRAGVPRELWVKRPHHAFRKGFVSGLKRAGADDEAVEYLVGHSQGVRGLYLDPAALPLKDAVARIPALSGASQMEPVSVEWPEDKGEADF